MNRDDLRPVSSSYLASRQAIGFKYVRHEKLINDFLKHVGEKISGSDIGRLALDWSCLTAKPDAVAEQAFRFRVVRGFLAYIKTVFPETVVPSSGLLARPSRPRPFIFLPDHIVSLLDLAGSLKPHGSLRPCTYQTILGLLASCGLRSKEALGLRMADAMLDIDPPRLHIFETKFGKSRLVPLHHTTADRMRQYRKRRSERLAAGLADPFFVSNRGKPMTYCALKRLFRQLVTHLGISPAGGQRGPSIHSLRHFFAVQRLVLWYQQGADVRSHLPFLSIYLGHARFVHSYWYLSAIPELLTAAAERFARYAEKGGKP